MGKYSNNLFSRIHGTKNNDVIRINVLAPKIRNINMSPCGSYLSFETNWKGDDYNKGFIYNTRDGLVYVDSGYLQLTFQDIDFLLWEFELQELKPYWNPKSFCNIPNNDFRSDKCYTDVKEIVNMIMSNS